jgi:malonyl CoA-acyl carrier protein transacylase
MGLDISKYTVNTTNVYFDVMRHTKFHSRRESLDGPLFSVEIYSPETIMKHIKHVTQDTKERAEIAHCIKEYFKKHQCVDSFLCIQYKKYNLYFQLTSALPTETATTVRIATRV